MDELSEGDRPVRGIWFCRGEDQASFYFHPWYGRDASSYEILQWIREKFLTAVTGENWWPVELAPVPLPSPRLCAAQGMYYTIRHFRPVYFENELIALLLR